MISKVSYRFISRITGTYKEIDHENKRYQTSVGDRRDNPYCGIARYPGLCSRQATVFDLTSAVKDIQTKVTNIQTILTGFQTTLPDIGTSITDISANLTTWFGPSGEYRNVERVIKSEQGYSLKGAGENLVVAQYTRDKPFKVTISFAATNLTGDEFVEFRYNVGGSIGDHPAHISSFTINPENDRPRTYEVSTVFFDLIAGNPISLMTA